GILYGMTADSIVNVTEAQAKLNKLIEEDSFAISRHGKIVGVYLSRDRIEALVETMELLTDAKFAKAVKDYEAGRMKFRGAKELDKEMSE
ncbi:MAG: hypothetical protein ACXW32_13210, partial [Limisphaerales bacterium]